MTNSDGILKKKLPSIKLVAVFLWLVLSLALAGWWLLFGLKQIDKISGLQNASAQEILRQHRMLMSEGGVLFALLLIGGLSLLYYISVEMIRAKQLQTFFAAFTHDLKTALASLRLQAEALDEELPKEYDSKFPKRIIRDTVRLELQLNNSLALAQDDEGRLFIEDIYLKKTIASLNEQWSDLKVEVENDCILQVDTRAFESICKNIIQNAIIHGHAKTMRIVCKSLQNSPTTSQVQIDFQDDGEGFKGKQKLLAKLFLRHSSTSGSGIGLYLVKTLCARLGGHVEFSSGISGFKVSVILPGRLV